MATSIINTLEGYYTLTFTGAQVQSLLNYMSSFSTAGVEEMIANSFVGLDSSTTSTNAHIIAETNEGNEVTTAIPPATTTNAGVMTAADKTKLDNAVTLDRYQGKGDEATAYDDPQIFLPGIESWADLNSYLNSVGTTTASDEARAGWLSFHINGVPIKVLCQVQGYGNQVWSQMAFGQIKVEGGELAQDYFYPTILVRYRDNTGWKTWKKINE